MSGRRIWGLSAKKSLGSDRGIKYTPYKGAGGSSGSLGMVGRNDDDLEDIAVVTNANPEQVKYGSGSITQNGPRVVPGK